MSFQFLIEKERILDVHLSKITAFSLFIPSIIVVSLFGTSSIESWFIKDLVFSPFGGWDAEKWYHF